MFIKNLRNMILPKSYRKEIAILKNQMNVVQNDLAFLRGKNQITYDRKPYMECGQEYFKDQKIYLADVLLLILDYLGFKIIEKPAVPRVPLGYLLKKITNKKD